MGSRTKPGIFQKEDELASLGKKRRNRYKGRESVLERMETRDGSRLQDRYKREALPFCPW